MRISVEFEAHGSTVNEIIEDASRQWREFMTDDRAVLPHDTEINVTPHDATDYRGTVFARIKVETNG